MTEITALDKHACPACGAQAEWNPAKQLLMCPYCGTQSPYEIDNDSGAIRELDLVQALRELSDERRGWDARKRSVRCRSCHAISVFDPEKVGKRCDFCGSPELVDYEEIKAPIRPESVLPFKISSPQIHESMRKWYSDRWFAPNRLKKKALVDTVRGLYIPYWTFDARVRCPWTAEAGYYYYTTESYTDSQGRHRTKQVRHVRWEESSGEIDHTFDDELISGSQGVDPELLQQVEPFPTRELVPYDTAFLSGFVVEHYQVVLFEAAQRARSSMEQQLYNLCAQEVPGDTFRDLSIYPDYSNQTFKHILVPIWLLTYNYGPQTFQVVANGYTGAIAGRYPKSWVKILLLILTIVSAVVVAAVLANL